MPNRQSVIAMADTYLQGGLVAHNGKLVRLAADCFRHENGWYTGGKQIISDHFPRMTMCRGIRNLHWVVEGAEAIAMFDLARDDGSDLPIFEYFRVGTIGVKEISPTFPADEWMLNAIEPADAKSRRCDKAPKRRGAEAETVMIGNRLLRALKAGTPAKAPLGGDVTFVEDGKVVGRELTAVRAALEGPRWTGIKALRLQRWTAEGKEAVARYELGLADGRLLIGSLYIRVHAGLVRELQSCSGAGPSSALVKKFNARKKA